MYQHIQTPKDIQEKMKEFRETNCSGVSATEFGDFARRVASIIPREEGMRRGIIGSLGELWACVRFGLNLMPKGAKGYDALDPTGRLGATDIRYQIKSRHPEKAERVDPMGATPSFTNWEFDKALLILMDKDLQNYETWLADRQSIKTCLRHNRKDIQIQRFQAIGQRIYPA